MRLIKIICSEKRIRFANPAQIKYFHRGINGLYIEFGETDSCR